MITASKVSISVGALQAFHTMYYLHPNPTLRFGQAFCNQYNITDQTLFYESDARKAFAHIIEEYVDYEDSR